MSNVKCPGKIPDLHRGANRSNAGLCKFCDGGQGRMDCEGTEVYLRLRAG